MDRKFRLLSILVVVVLILLEQVLHLDSFMKQGFKIVLLVLVPLVLLYKVRKTSFGEEYNLRDVTYKKLRFPLVVGILIYLGTILGYVVLNPLIDSDLVVDGLKENGITAGNIIIACLYLSFINSFLEEFFFRGFMYKEFSRISVRWGYVVSSVFFSVYHVLVMFTLFDWAMGVISIIGLFVVGLVLTSMNRTNKSIINSWIVHIFADLGVVSIGLYLFFG